MRISLIGTSGSGKSYWSGKFEKELGYQRFSCDELIEEKLRKLLAPYGTGIHALAAWMGEPFEERYKETSAKYLQFEEEVLNEVVEELKNSKDDKIIVDTTGSFIYTNKSVREKLKTLCTMVYLEVPTEARDEVFALYFSDPKPIIWGDSFSKRIDEDERLALARCYHNLMEFRTVEYEAHADKILPFEKHKKEIRSAKEFLELVRK